MMAFVFVACSQDETIEVNRNNDVIRFGVVTDAATRAADIYCNNNLPASFKVWAEYNNLTYIEGSEIVRNGTAWTSSKDVYWPAGEVSFYAHVNAGDKFVWSPDKTPTIEEYVVDTDLTKQQDLLYAVKKQKREEGVTTVQLNFRHALSQIVFQAKNTNPDLGVVIDGVSVCNVGNTNTFVYPKENTDDNIVNHDGKGDNSTTGAWGEWEELNEGETKYSVSFSQGIAINGNSTDISLTSAIPEGQEFNSNAMLLLPQTTTAWNPNTSNKPNTQTGSYFLIKCKIYQTAKDVNGNDVKVYLWGDENTTKEVAIPVALNWEQSKKYIYTFVFGQGNGGYNPNPEGDKPEPVLFPITFDATVDDFINGSETDIPLDPVVPEVLPDLTFVQQQLTDEQIATLKDGGTVTISGTDYQPYTHLRLYHDSACPNNPEQAINENGIECSGKLVVMDFQNGAISVKVGFTTIEITNNKVETIDIGGTNIKVIIKDNEIDGKNRYHLRHDITDSNSLETIQANKSGDFAKGFYLYSPQYELTFENNKIYNTIHNAIGINGWGMDQGKTGDKIWGQNTPLNLNNIISFKNNNIQASDKPAINIIGDNTYYTYDATYAASENYDRSAFDPYKTPYEPDTYSSKAVELINNINATENNNQFSKASGVAGTSKFMIRALYSLTGNGIKSDNY